MARFAEPEGDFEDSFAPFNGVADKAVILHVNFRLDPDGEVASRYRSCGDNLQDQSVDVDADLLIFDENEIMLDGGD